MSDSNHNGTALVTGASAGIGAVYADRLARRGHDLVLVARDGRRLEQLAARLRGEYGVKAEVLEADLTQKPDLLRVEQRLRDDDAITTLVNNAGVGGTGPLASSDPDRLETLVQLNVLAVTRLAAAIVPRLVVRKSGTIINIASVLALAPEIGGTAYSGSKAYVLAFTQALYTEMGPHGVRVQAVLPGATRTEIWQRAGRDIATIPAAMLMEADEMVDAALAGLDQGELVTIPSLPDPADWDVLTAARLQLGPNLSRNHAADRYKPDGAILKSATPLYLEDLATGQRLESGSLTLDELQIKAFARKFDPQSFHLDDTAARATLFGGLAASGWHTAALTMKLMVDSGLPIAGGIVGAGGEISWPRPARPGDTLTVSSEVLEATPSKSRPDRGIATIRSTTTNQNGDAVQVLTMKLVVPRRPLPA